MAAPLFRPSPRNRSWSIESLYDFSILGGAKEHVAGILSLRVLVSGTKTQWKDATMVLNIYKVGAGLAVSDMDRAREFYESKLGLS